MVPPCFAGDSHRPAFRGRQRPALCNGRTRQEPTGRPQRDMRRGLRFGSAALECHSLGSSAAFPATAALWDSVSWLLFSVIADEYVVAVYYTTEPG